MPSGRGPIHDLLLSRGRASAVALELINRARSWQPLIVELSGNIQGSATVASPLDVVVPVSGDMTGSGAPSAGLGPVVPVSGSLSGSGTPAAALAPVVPVSGDLAGSGVLAAGLGPVVPVSGSLAGSGAPAGAVQSLVGVSGDVAGSGTLAAAVQSLVGVSGDVAGAGALAAAVQSLVGLAGAVSGTGTLTGALRSLVGLTGAVAGAGTPTGGLVVVVDLMSAPGPQPVGNSGAWSLEFEDTFPGSSIDTTKWNRNWFGDNDDQITGPLSPVISNVDPTHLSVADGELTLLLTDEDSTSAQGVFHTWTGAMAHTYGKFNFIYGHMEARIKLPGLAGDGSDLAGWLAWWTDGEGNPSVEIDAMESLGSNGGATTNVHLWNPGNNDLGIQQVSPLVKAGWHVIGAEWVDGHVDFYYDGVLVRTITNAGITEQPTPNFLILENGARSNEAKDVSPSEMVVDYVRVWQRASVASGSAVEGSTTLDGSLQVVAPVTGALSGSGALSGAIRSLVGLAGGVGSSGGPAASAQVLVALAGALAGQGTLAGDVSSIVSLTGAVNASGVLAGAAEAVVGITGGVTGGASVNAELSAVIALLGALDGSGVLTGDLELQGQSFVEFSGAILGQGALAADVETLVGLAGAAAGAGAVVGDLGALVVLAGDVAGSATIVGTLDLSGFVELAGEILGQGSAAGDLQMLVGLDGSVAGGGLPAAYLATLVAIYGSIDGVSHLTGALSGMHFPKRVAKPPTVIGVRGHAASIGIRRPPPQGH